MGYHTRQKEALLACLKASVGVGLSVAEILALLKSRRASVGRTTVYRLLDELVADGRVRRYSETGSRERRYEYIDDQATFDVRCSCCHRIFHLHCQAFASMLTDLREHIHNFHGFTLEENTPLFHGICPSCRVKQLAHQMLDTDK